MARDLALNDHIRDEYRKEKQSLKMKRIDN